MKIVGGSYGVTGKMSIEGNDVVVQSAITKRIPGSLIAQINTHTHSERNFSLLTFLLRCLVLGGLGGFFLGSIGIVVGLLAALGGAFPKKATLGAQVTFLDGSHVTVEGWHYELQKLAKLPENCARNAS